MSYYEAAHFAQTWGVVLLTICFAIAAIYALWPANKQKFERAAQAPLIDGDDDDGQ